ncbi:MAG: tetratricopeptide repeat protein [Deltaproteobacteria bacterium]|nr:tetratricopeptide repeat protein [Deltaproteobacteria bacterium]
MSAPALSKLWPVITMLATLLIGTLALQVYAESHDSQALVVAIHPETTAAVEDEALDDSDGSLELGRSVSPDHANARGLARRGDLVPALRLFRKAAAANPESGWLLAEYGYWLLVAKQAPDAVTALKRAEKLQPREPRIALYAGMALRQVGDLVGAEAELRRAIALHPGFGSALIALGRLLGAQGKQDEAVAYLTEAGRSGANEQRARASVALGRVLLATGRAADAEQAFAAAINWAPAQAEIRIAAARAYLDLDGDHNGQRALEIASRATELAPDLPRVHLLLGDAKSATGDVDGAEVAYLRALHLDPSYTAARRKLIRLALDRRDFGQARAQTELLLSIDAEPPEHHFLAGLVASRSGRLDEARASYKTAIAKANGVYPEAYLNLGAVLRDADDLPGAIAAYRQALKQKPDYLAALNNLGLALAAADRTKEAEATYRKALAINPDYAAALLNLGKLQSASERYQEAIVTFERLLSIKPGYRQALLNLGVAQRRSGNAAAAITTYRRLVQAEPRYVAAHYNLGLALEAENELGAARDAYRQAAALEPEHLPSLRRLGTLEAKLGDLPAAAAIYQTILELEPGDANTRLALADVALRRGDKTTCERESDLAARSSTDKTAAAQLSRRCRADARMSPE